MKLTGAQALIKSLEMQEVEVLFGLPGGAMGTSGPAATTIVTPLCNAYMDSTPIVVITGQVASTAIGTDAFQECDTTGITMPVTKHNWLITDAQDIPRVVKEAFHVATKIGRASCRERV